MSRGLNTEIDARNLPPGSFSEFTQVTLRGGTLQPRSADESHTAAGGSLEEWRLTKLGTYDFCTVYDAEKLANYEVYVAKSAGTPTIYDHGTTTEEALVIAAPAYAFADLTWHFQLTSSAIYGGHETSAGLPDAESRVYTYAYRTGLDFVTGLSDTITITNDAKYAEGNTLTGNAPAFGATITCTRPGPTTINTAKCRGWVALDGGAYRIVISTAEKSDTDAWQAGDTISWSGGSFVLTGADTDWNLPVWVAFDTGGIAVVPTSVDEVVLFGLETATGYWREIGTQTTIAAGNYVRDDEYFPYDNPDLTILLPVWPGPLDLEYLPETLLSSITAGQTLCVHKGCLFVAEGSKIRFSEPEQPRYFREWAVLDAFDSVIGMVSRDEVMEVYTARAVKYIIGNAPYFEIRETGITEGPVSRNSICRTDVGTFALFEDGIYLVTGATRRNLSAGVLGPTVEAMTRSTAVGGAAKGIYYLCDGTTCYAYDWERDEWFHRTFTAAPLGFHYSDTVAALIAKLTGPSYKKVGTDASTSVAWAAHLPEQGDGRYRAGPRECFLDLTGMVAFDFRSDGVSRVVHSITNTERIFMPIERCRYFSARLSGTGKASDTEIRAWEWRA